jgi:transcriptional regulator with XRE-family HTH domain
MSADKRIKKDKELESDEEIIASMKLILRSDYAPSIPPEVIHTYLSLPVEEIEVDTNLMFGHFIKKVLADLHRRPVRNIAPEWPFGRWLEDTRQSVRFSRTDIAGALNKDESFVERLETGEILPWQLSLYDAAEIVILFRVHMDAIKQLVESSYVVSKAREALEKAEQSGHRGKPFAEADPLAKLTVDLYYARNSEPIEMSEEAKQWLKDLLDELKQHEGGRILLRK